MEAPEVPTEHLHEQIQEEVEGHHGGKKERWTLYVAITTGLMAVFAALGSLFAGHHSNEALIEQIRSSDQWAFYQAKGIKAEVVQSTITNKKDNHLEVPEELKEKAARYKDEQKEIQKKAEEYVAASEKHLQRHVTLAQSVTLFQISIAISAIGMLTKRKFLWHFSLILSSFGLVFFILGLV